MPAKSVFTAKQRKILQVTLGELIAKYGQKGLETKLKIKQQSISDLMSGKYAPSYATAVLIAKHAGTTLEMLVGELGAIDASQPLPLGWAPPPLRPGAFPNLDLCIGFMRDRKTWSPWTVAAARAGFFGEADLPAPDWEARLDTLEKALERARKAG